ncbi:MAG: elongation factor P [bacterium]
MIDTSDFRNGMHIILDRDIYTIVEFQHVKPGKGGAFVRTRLKKLTTGQALEKTFRAGEKMEQAMVERTKMVYLYRQGDEYVLMDQESYEQIPISIAMLGDQAKYLKEEMELTVLTGDGVMLGVEAPTFVELEVVETDPTFKGDTVSGGGKPAKLETGAIINVPFFVEVGDVVKVDTRTDSYLERVKK